MFTLTDIQPQKNEIYLDNNATTPVLPQAAEAAMHTMQLCYGNPSSSHITGIKAKYILETTRSLVRKVIGAENGDVTFVSGATEGIQTSIISALHSARESGIKQKSPVLLYGATEHKAVPETLKHWNHILNIGADILAIPVDQNGILDLEFIRHHIDNALIVCTMAANNETGVFQDLKALEQAVRSSNNYVLWMVDCVQALGKIPLNISKTTIDYAPFSGHKLYAPKGIGFLYIREGAPFTPFIAGGGQESGLRSGTENLPGIAALHAVLALLDDEDDSTFKSHDELVSYREQLTATLCEAFPKIIFNHHFDYSLPTTLNFSVEGLSSKDIMDLFDAARIRVSSGSACSSKVSGSFVLDAMGIPKWQSNSAIRMSFGPATTQLEIDQACVAINQAVTALQHCCLVLSDTQDNSEFAVDGLQQWIYDQQCTWFYVDKAAGECVLIDVIPELSNKFETLVQCQNYQVNGILETHRHTNSSQHSAMLRELMSEQQNNDETDSLGWIEPSDKITLDNGQQVPAIKVGKKVIAKLSIPGHTKNSVVYLLGGSDSDKLPAKNIEFAFVGDSIQIGGLGRTDLQDSNPEAFYLSLQSLAAVIDDETLICPSHDYQQLFSTTMTMEQQNNPLLKEVINQQISASDFVTKKAQIDEKLPPTDNQNFCGSISVSNNSIGNVPANELADFISTTPDVIVVDVREPHEFEAYPDAVIAGKKLVNIPLSQLTNFVNNYRDERTNNQYICICRSGKRSDAAAKTLKRNGFTNVHHVPGGFALLNSTDKWSYQI